MTLGSRIPYRPLALLAAGALLFAAGRLSARRVATPTVINTAATRAADDLAHSLDGLEARLAVSRAAVDEQLELQRRHERISAIACTNAAWHASDMRHIVESHRRRAAAHSSAPPSDDDCDSCTIPLKHPRAPAPAAAIRPAAAVPASQ